MFNKLSLNFAAFLSEQPGPPQNNKIKLLKRRCYGIEKVTTLFQRLVLDLKGYQRFA